jgi:hypothetical protein
MLDESLSIDQKPGRWLVAVAGGLLCEAGVQAMLTSQTTPIWISTLIAGIGAIFILVALFWKKVRLNRFSFFAGLNRIASHPGLWIGMIVFVWLSTVTVDALREIRRNNEIVALRNDVQSIARVIERGVLPRHLNKRQRLAISSFLLQFEPHEFAFKIEDKNGEASSYRSDLEQALEKGGWTRSRENPYEYTKDIPEGLSIDFTQTVEHSQRPDDPRNPKPDKLFMMGLGLAGIRLNQSGGRSGINITEDRLIIGIGRRRMDSYELTLPDDF